MTANVQSRPDEAILLRDDVDGVATLTMNRPAARNALSMALMTAMMDALKEIRADTSVKSVVIAGAGPAYCAGHDLKELRANPSRQSYEAAFELCSQLMMTIVHLPQPVVAKVHATATAAGCQLVASCDLAVAAEGAKFATPGVNIGLFCSTPMVALSRAVGRKRAMEMLLTGETIGAEEAQAAGLVNRVVAPDALDDEIETLTRTLAEKSPLTVSIGKEAFYRQIDLGLEDAYAYASATMTRNMMAADAAEGIDAFLEKRKPAWTGR
ncbi:MAG: enoyl-CoA hydratase [Rhodospirillales bacterium]|jgi:enoyl-CoA hydratase/carnithine racemase|nr:enoyl-CoA hydratase [Rhodospirillales bacterium]